MNRRDFLRGLLGIAAAAVIPLPAVVQEQRGPAKIDFTGLTDDPHTQYRLGIKTSERLGYCVLDDKALVEIKF